MASTIPPTSSSNVATSHNTYRFVRSVSPPTSPLPTWSAISPSSQTTTTNTSAHSSQKISPLLPQDYAQCRIFAQQALQQIIEVLERRRPLSHLKPFTTPEIVAALESAALKRYDTLSPTSPAAPLRLMRIHMRTRALTTEEMSSLQAMERHLPPGFRGHAQIAHASHPVPPHHSHSCTTPPSTNLHTEICGTYRDGKRVQAFAGCAQRRDSHWRITAFHLI